MRITYLGHACFKIEGSDSEVVVDPFTGIGLPEPEAEADLVLCSHGHRDHSNTTGVAKGDARVLVGFVGETAHGGVRVRGIPAFHDPAQGSMRGSNSIYVLEIDGIVLCHLGDLGHELSQDQVRSIGKVDVFFVPVGGFFTIGPEVASKVCDMVGPKITIPMHFRTDRHSPGFDRLSTVDDFVAIRDGVERYEGREIDLQAGDVPEEPVTLVLSS
jgi:L-ascorbate metabolism protein UlaG (beta-lactamase superfamily)